MRARIFHIVPAYLHPLLLVLFFLLHNYRVYYGMVSAGAVLGVFFKLAIIFTIIIFLLWLFTKNTRRSLLVASIAGMLFLFYGEIKDLVTKLSPVLAKYSLLLPLSILFTVLIIRICIRERNLHRAEKFLSLLFFTWLIIEVFGFLITDSDIYLRKNLLVKKQTIESNRPDSSAEPDIYLIVLDSYPGNEFLQNYLGYDNTSFDSALARQGFRVLDHPRSNYNRTAFSIASLLNGSYLQGIDKRNSLLAKNYNHARATIDHAAVPEFLLAKGYELYNLSAFDLAGQPPVRRESFLTLPEQRMLLYNTLPERIRTDILWNLLTGKFKWEFARRLMENSGEAEVNDQRDFNNRMIDSLKKIPFLPAGKPKFVYAHLYLPHPPFYYNENGQPNSASSVIDPTSQENRELFLSYLRYTNKVTESVTSGILTEKNRNAVILLQSDHGYRDFKGWQSHPEYYHVNFSAWYFPDRDYRMLYDSMTNVNSFPVLLGKYFGANMPLQKDSVVNLPY